MYTIHEEFTGKVFLDGFEGGFFGVIKTLNDIIAECTVIQSAIFAEGKVKKIIKGYWDGLADDLKRHQLTDQEIIERVANRFADYYDAQLNDTKRKFSYQLPYLKALRDVALNSDFLMYTPFHPIAAAILDALPHGSGIDGDWHIVIAPAEHGKGYSVTCKNSYHAMNSAGMYDGWVDFSFSFSLNGSLKPILGKHGEIEFSDLTFSPTIAELVEQSEKEYPTSEDDTEFYGVDWQGIEDYLQETIGYCLSELSSK